MFYLVEFLDALRQAAKGDIALVGNLTPSEHVRSHNIDATYRVREKLGNDHVENLL